MRRPINRLISRGLFEIECMEAFAEAVARFEGWTGPALNHQRRVWQALAENTDRKLDAEWVAIAVRLFAYHDRGDLCDEVIGYLQRQRWEGEREREERPPKAAMRTVRARWKQERAS